MSFGIPLGVLKQSLMNTFITSSCPRIIYFKELFNRNCSDSFGPYVWLIPRFDGVQPLVDDGSDHNKSQKRPSF